MIGICIPAHNERDLIARCLDAVLAAARHRELQHEPVIIAVILDGCTDDTAAIAATFPVTCLSIPRSNVGIARAIGMQHLIQRGARWLASTDADTVVAHDWLAAQLALGAEVVCGTVDAHDFSAHGHEAQQVLHGFRSHYQDADGHRHVHGANLGMTTDAYLRAGGFPPLACSEDQALVDQLVRDGANIAWSARPRVITSARALSRVEGGFASALRNGAMILPRPASPSFTTTLLPLSEEPHPSAG